MTVTDHKDVTTVTTVTFETVTTGVTDVYEIVTLVVTAFETTMDSDHETGLKRRTVAGATSTVQRFRPKREAPYLFWIWSPRFTYAVDPPTL